MSVHLQLYSSLLPILLSGSCSVWTLINRVSFFFCLPGEFNRVVLCLVTQSCLTLCNSTDCGLRNTAVHGDSLGKYWSVLPCPSPGNLPNPGIKLRYPALQEDSLQSEPLGKPLNTGMGSLSLLQVILLTQESNWGLCIAGDSLPAELPGKPVNYMHIPSTS